MDKRFITARCIITVCTFLLVLSVSVIGTCLLVMATGTTSNMGVFVLGFVFTLFVRLLSDFSKTI
jgi:hypothetical protein